MLLLAAPAAAAGDKDLLGWAERVLVGRSQLVLRAKLDTGADTSSLSATRIRRYRRGSERWVEFTVVDETSGRRVRFKRPLLRRVRIKEHDGSGQSRPVVKVEICLGDHQRRVEVSLVDRSNFDYPMLLGRRALEGIAVVDPELRFTTRPDCPPSEDGEEG